MFDVADQFVNERVAYCQNRHGCHGYWRLIPSASFRRFFDQSLERERVVLDAKGIGRFEKYLVDAVEAGEADQRLIRVDEVDSVDLRVVISKAMA